MSSIRDHYANSNSLYVPLVGGLQGLLRFVEAGGDGTFDLSSFGTSLLPPAPPPPPPSPSPSPAPTPAPAPGVNGVPSPYLLYDFSSISDAATPSTWPNAGTAGNAWDLVQVNTAGTVITGLVVGKTSADSGSLLLNHAKFQADGSWRFGATGDTRTMDNAAAQGDGWTVFIVAQVLDGTYAVALLDNPTNAVQAGSGFTGVANDLVTFCENLEQAYGTEGLAGGASVTTAQWAEARTLGDCKLRINLAVPSGLTYSPSSASTVDSGAFGYLGGDTLYNSDGCRLAEFRAYRGQLTTDQIDYVEKFLHNKWINAGTTVPTPPTIPSASAQGKWQVGVAGTGGAADVTYVVDPGWGGTPTTITNPGALTWTDVVRADVPEASLLSTFTSPTEPNLNSFAGDGCYVQFVPDAGTVVSYSVTAEYDGAGVLATASGSVLAQPPAVVFAGVSTITTPGTYTGNVTLVVNATLSVGGPVTLRLQIGGSYPVVAW